MPVGPYAPGRLGGARLHAVALAFVCGHQQSCTTPALAFLGGQRTSRSSVTLAFVLGHGPTCDLTARGPFGLPERGSRCGHLPLDDRPALVVIYDIAVGVSLEDRLLSPCHCSSSRRRECVLGSTRPSRLASSPRQYRPTGRIAPTSLCRCRQLQIAAAQSTYQRCLNKYNAILLLRDSSIVY